MEPRLLPPGTDALRVSIAVPMDGDERRFGTSNKPPHFNVVLLNASDKPQKIWAEDCSAGNSNLTLEIMAMDSETLPQPILVERRAATWFRNRVRGVTLEPGDTVVREIHLYQYQPMERSSGLPLMFSDQVHYIGFPSLGPNSCPHFLRMQAIFGIEAGEKTKAQDIWTGRVISETRDYTVWGHYL